MLLCLRSLSRPWRLGRGGRAGRRGDSRGRHPARARRDGRGGAATAAPPPGTPSEGRGRRHAVGSGAASRRRSCGGVWSGARPRPLHGLGAPRGGRRGRRAAPPPGARLGRSHPRPTRRPRGRPTDAPLTSRSPQRGAFGRTGLAAAGGGDAARSPAGATSPSAVDDGNDGGVHVWPTGTLFRVPPRPWEKRCLGRGCGGFAVAGGRRWRDGEAAINARWWGGGRRSTRWAPDD